MGIKNYLTLLLISVFVLGVNATASTTSKVETCEESVHVFVNGEYKGSYKMEVEGSDCGTTVHWIR